MRTGVNESVALLERDHELEVLDRLVQGALDGDAVLALLEGPAGIGKSTVLAEARDKAAAAGFRVLAARGSDLERELPYGVVRQLFESLPDDEGRERWLSGSAAAAARVLQLFSPQNFELFGHSLQQTWDHTIVSKEFGYWVCPKMPDPPGNSG